MEVYRFFVLYLGSPAKLLLTLSGEKGPETLELQEVALMEVSGVKVSNGTVEKMGGGDYLVTVKEVPQGEFVVLLKGKDKTFNSLFQRQTTTQMSQSKVTIKVQTGFLVHFFFLKLSKTKR